MEDQDNAKNQAKAQLDSIKEMLENEDYDAISEGPLSVQVRSGWTSPEHPLEPEEFEILLCTGGPAVRIIGELNEHNEPYMAWLQYQDWGTRWTEYYEEGIDDTLLKYASHFYFGN